VLIDAGDTNKGKVVLEALKRYNVQQLDYFIATHPHPESHWRRRRSNQGHKSLARYR